MTHRDVNAMVLKDAGLRWLRFDRQMVYVATEVGPWSSDLLGADQKRCIEIEVKVSIADLKNDFIKPKHKHFKDGPVIKAPYGDYPTHAPNQFYFLVPLWLAKDALPIIEAKGPDYGLMTFAYPEGMPFGTIKVERKAGWIHRAPPERHLLDVIAKRMASDLVGTYMMHVRIAEMRRDLFFQMRGALG